jgi:hypothetical protein
MTGGERDPNRGEVLVCHLPTRVLPVSTSPPTDLTTLFESEVAEVKKRLKPGRRRQVEALARLRPLAILDATIQGEKGQPSDADLRRIGKEVLGGTAVKRVDELGLYNLGAKQLAANLGLTMPKAVAVVDHLDLRDDPECYKEFKIGKTQHKRYSRKAIHAIKALKDLSADEIWQNRKVTARRGTA